MSVEVGLSGTGISNLLSSIVAVPVGLMFLLFVLWPHPLFVMALGAASGLSLWAVLHGRWPIQLLLAVVLVLPVFMVTCI